MNTVINQVITDNFAAYNGDCVEVLPMLKENSIGLSVYSPPFASLFTFSDSERDMANVSSNEEFFECYQKVVDEIFRTTKEGRLTCVHCIDIPTTKGKDGVVGFYDFSGDIIKAHIKAGFTYHDRITIWKDPVVEMQRTKALGLLYKTCRTDATRTRTGNADYILTFRKPVDGVNDKTPDPVTHNADEYAVSLWQKVASPVWMDINQSDTLNVKIARSDKDLKHLSPLQLGVIERLVLHYSNKGDVVLTPFLGVGSEAYVALKLNRKAIGIELKEEYFKTAVGYLKEAESSFINGRLI
jgi:DNA modification methylase